MKQAKRAAVVKQLSELRSLNPPVPMASTLDIDNERERVRKEARPAAAVKLQQKKRSSTPPVPMTDNGPSFEHPHLEQQGLEPIFTSTPNFSAGTYQQSSISATSTDPVPVFPDSPSPVLPGHLSASPEHSPSPLLPAAKDLSAHVSQLHSYSLQSQVESSPPLLFPCTSYVTTAAEPHQASLPGYSCPCQCKQFEQRLKSLEAKMDKFLERQTSSSKKITPSPHLSAQKGEWVRKTGKSPKNKPLFEKVLQDFHSFRLGARTGRKDRENAKQAMSHGFRFCLYMASGQPASMTSDLRFLGDVNRLRVWPAYLTKKGYSPTTVKNMLHNVASFFNHVENCFMSQSRLKHKDLVAMRYELKSLQSDVQRQVVVHRQKVLKKKSDDQLDAGQAKEFMKAARKKIPKLLRSLSRKPSATDHALLTGYILCYLAILTGHRSVVFINMTKENVSNSESWDHGTKFQVLVDEHKTVKTFGQAALSLDEEEFQWLQDLAKRKCCGEYQLNPLVFHGEQGKPLRNACSFLQSAWSDAGMAGNITFTKIRSSVSTQANRYLSEKERRQLAKSMCHDPNTADRFYVALPDKETGHQTRKLRLKALEKASSHPPQYDTETPSTSSDEEEPPYDDEVSSPSLVSSSEELDDKNSDWVSHRRKLSFSPKKECEPCVVTLDRLRPKIAEYYLYKQRSGTKQALSVQPEAPRAEEGQETPAEQAQENMPEPTLATVLTPDLILDTPDMRQDITEFVPDTLLEEMADIPVEDKLSLVLTP
ncbi:uncharacterized protein LOC121525531 isoform X2 [Cheilinus undulatus]|uniref:uncharacterized protein LOC121525531 isoform X2 n=1 Tax=Cheilinus undulatus TaxID=241271 RepID=UPI001BD3CE97|nr:uncharacterized protein LOC121525531 isoform X2 [Cheilinus undulatus]